MSALQKKSEMAKEIICKSIKLDSMLNTFIKAEKFLCGLFDIPESNYAIFIDFNYECYGFGIRGAVTNWIL